jgi:hypothetical protein
VVERSRAAARGRRMGHSGSGKDPERLAVLDISATTGP